MGIIKGQNPVRVRDSHWAYRTLEETGRAMGVSKQRVEQIERALIRKLRYRVRTLMAMELDEYRGKIPDGESFRQLCRWQMEAQASDERSARQRNLRRS